jgi:hypothetical protein
MQIVYKKVADLIPYERNPRKHDHAVKKFADIIKAFGFRIPILVKSDNTIIDGHFRLKAAAYLKLEDVPTVIVDDMTDAEIKAFRISINRSAEFADWDEDLLKLEFEELKDLDFDLDLTGFDELEIDELFGDIASIDDQQKVGEKNKGSLADKFMIPPFSVLNAREGWWQNRKRQWLAIGIKSELGRGGGLLITSEQLTANNLNFYSDKNKNG